MAAKRIRYTAALLLSLVFSAASARECDKVIVTADPSYPPLHWYDGQSLHGASIDIVSMVLDRLGIPYEVRYIGPFARVLRMAEIGDVDIVTTLKITPERQAYLAYVPTAAFLNPISVFVRRGEPFHYTNWDDLLGKRGGIARGNKFGGGFDEFLASRLTVEAANELGQNFNKLKAGRIDYFVTGRYAGLAYLAQNGQEAEFSVLNPTVTETWNHVAFSKNSPCLKNLPAFDQQLDALVRSGKVQAILDENLNRFRQNNVRSAKDFHSP